MAAKRKIYDDPTKCAYCGAKLDERPDCPECHEMQPGEEKEGKKKKGDWQHYEGFPKERVKSNRPGISMGRCEFEYRGLATCPFAGTMAFHGTERPDMHRSSGSRHGSKEEHWDAGKSFCWIHYRIVYDNKTELMSGAEGAAGEALMKWLEVKDNAHSLNEYTTFQKPDILDPDYLEKTRSKRHLEEREKFIKYWYGLCRVIEKKQREVIKAERKSRPPPTPLDELLEKHRKEWEITNNPEKKKDDDDIPF